MLTVFDQIGSQNTGSCREIVLRLAAETGVGASYVILIASNLVCIQDDTGTSAGLVSIIAGCAVESSC